MARYETVPGIIKFAKDNISAAPQFHALKNWYTIIDDINAPLEQKIDELGVQSGVVWRIVIFLCTLMNI